MQAHEAITLLESLDPSHEVTLTIGRKAKTNIWPQLSQHNWVLGRDQWVDRNPLVYKNDITCSKLVH
jgi:hypothetical protein